MTRRHVFIAVLVLVLVSIGRPQAQNNPQATSGSWRPTIVAQHGMVAAGHPLAAEAGMRILKAGGNAIDAAIATWAVQGEVEPGMTGLGADMFVLYYNAKTREVKFINGTGYAPQAATIDYYKSKGGIPDEGPLSISVPGAVGGAAYAVKTYGTKTLSEVLAPAIEIADGGFPVTEALASTIESSKAKLAKFPPSTRLYFKDGKPLAMGDIIHNPDLARTLRAIAAQGPDAFYKGDVAKNTAAFLKANGSIISEADLAGYQPYEDAPVHVNYRGVEVYECPPNSQGFVMLEALNILEGYNLKEMGRNSAPYLHAVTEALKLSFADRNAYVGDPKFVPNIPMKELLSKEYAAVRRTQIDPNRAIKGEPVPGDPRAMKATTAAQAQAYAAPQERPSDVKAFDPNEILNLTTYLAVVDKDHNMVSITSSLLSGFGSGMVVDKGGFVMNDRMRYFYLDPKDVNSLQPGKRTRQTINPAMALKDGKPWVSFGTPGSDTQPQTQLQFFLNVAEFGMNVQEALEQPTVISNSFRDSYAPHDVKGKLLTPAMLPVNVQEALAAKGHALDIRNVKGVGSVKAILIDPRTGVLMGGVSPTGDSYVMAW
ncbi:MAG TPA: gamma-glutamyltransferase [Vicinamibacterales bacterium]|jgi:gamma-glutamyltranspeptidase/glutathione hydrolase|nr:gamma-glutamyltransferase [Vicinamibacterales bacterium]